MWLTKCTNCGKTMLDDARYCSDCGQEIGLSKDFYNKWREFESTITEKDRQELFEGPKKPPAKKNILSYISIVLAAVGFLFIGYLKWLALALAILALIRKEPRAKWAALASITLICLIYLLFWFA